jgi:hypothetical protein
MSRAKAPAESRNTALAIVIGIALATLRTSTRDSCLERIPHEDHAIGEGAYSTYRPATDFSTMQPEVS